MFHRKKTINFSDPLQGRKYLLLLQEDPLSGIRFIPDLKLGPRVLGFTFDTNSLGLRGPSSVEGKGVIFGTSFATGMSVGNGCNWYELCLNNSEWLNLGLPIGLAQMEALFRHYYRGSSEIALVLYHPNYWRILKRWSESKESYFAAWRWETDFWRCLRLKIRKGYRASKNLSQGKEILFKYRGFFYRIDCQYSEFNFPNNQLLVLDGLRILERMLAGFTRVLFIRVPIKQELVPDSEKNELLRSTLLSYDYGWNLTKEFLGKTNSRIEFFEPHIFDLSDYHPQDTHWHEGGNIKFADYVRGLLGK